MVRFSSITKRYLERVGWYEGRSIDRAIIEEELMQDDFDRIESAILLLQEFHGLWINGFTFDTTDSECSAHSSITNRLSAFLGRRLCPIGGDLINTLFIDVSGKVYCNTFDYSLWLFANTPDDAVERLVKQGIDATENKSFLLEGEEFRRVFKGS